jgi:uncharacterized protein YgbK (DUF1537 family)
VSIRLIIQSKKRGCPCGRFIGGRADGMLVITKAGGFGEPNSLVKILFPDSEINA